MNEIDPDYVEIQTPWWLPEWVRDNPDKAAPVRGVTEPADRGLEQVPVDEYAINRYLTD